MKKFIKSGIVIMLSAVLILSQVAPMSFADRDNGKSQQKIEKKMNQKEYDPALKAELREKLKIMYAFGSDPRWSNLPKGMFNQGYLNYGLAKRYYNGQFPLGLAKKMKDFHFGEQHTVLSLKDLNELIASAEAKLLPANTKVYYPIPGAKDALLAAIVKAKAFATTAAAATVPVLEKDIKVQFDALKLAMVTFDNCEDLRGSATHLANLNALLVKLELYKTKYEFKFTPAKLASLEALITNIKQYTIASPTKVLTLGAYNEIMTEAKKFEDPITKLDTLINDIEAFIYVTPIAPTPVLKVTIGTAEGNYAPGSIDPLKVAIAAAKTFSANYLTASVNQIDTQYNLLNKAFTTFKDSIVLGTVQKQIITLVRDELQVYYTANMVPVTKPLSDLKALLDEMNSVINFPLVTPLTQTRFAHFLNDASKYIVDLFKPFKDELSKRIAAADALYLIPAKVGADDEKLALGDAIAKAKAFVATASVKTYEGYLAHINALNATISAYSTANQ